MSSNVQEEEFSLMKLLVQLHREHIALNEVPIKESDINILLLGETGVGKSTFINATHFYFLNTDLDDALRNDFEPLIPFSFSYEDMESEPSVISGGKKSEIENVNCDGESATQSCRSYAFTINDRVLRIIDTPGIGDTRGFERDMQNFQIISNYISKFTHLSAICFLMRPNQERASVQFKYCFNELLRHLTKSIRDNITFIFTCSRQTFFRPGSVRRLIVKLLQEQESESGMKLKFNNDNSFLFDNEGFRYIAIRKNGFDIPEDLKNSYLDSWKKTRLEYIRLLRYFITRPSCSIKETIDLIDVERIVRKLPRPIANVLQMIEENIQLGERFKENLLTSNGEQIEGVKQRRAETKRLKYPRTVCTNTTCSELIEENGEKRIEFKKICHDQCYLHGVAQEVIADPKLDLCESMDPFTQACSKCQCSWELHQHITYEYKTVIEEFKNLGDIDKRIRDLRSEISAIEEISEKLNLFLIVNSLAPINNAVVDYLDHFIQVENANKDRQTVFSVARLKALRNEMSKKTEEIKKAAEIFKTNPDDPSIPSTSDISALIEKLYTLPINGEMIRQQVKDIGQFEFYKSVEEVVIRIPTNCSSNSLVAQLTGLE